MNEFTDYTPTAGLPEESRNRTGFYSAVKSMLEELEGSITPWCSVTYDDENYNIILEPIDPNLAHFKLTVSADSSASNAIKLSYIRGGTSSESVNHNGYTIDPIFHIYFGENAFIIGLNSTQAFYIVGKGIHFGGNDANFIAASNNGANAAYFMASGTNYAYNTSSSYQRNCGGITSAYCIRPFSINSTDILTNSIYWFDGGMSEPPSGVFYVGNEKYCTLAKNICVKL